MTDLVTFLRVRLDEDEDDRQQWHARDCYLVKRGEDMFGDVEPCDCPGPARVLREVEAKRQILNYYAGISIDQGLSTPLVRGVWWVVYQLAKPYAEHPDYDAELFAGSPSPVQ